MIEEDSTNNERTAASHPHAISTKASYEIRVRDHLDPCWWQWFEGWSLTNFENGEVLLSNSNVDQSALHGVLNKIRDLNLTLLSVTKTEEEVGPA